jgi:hypothetical protein
MGRLTALVAWLRSIAPDLLVLAGILFMAYGAWLLAAWLGFIVLGAGLVAAVGFGQRPARPPRS